jgi:adenylate kinase family enzyme
VPLLQSTDALAECPRRVLIAGTSGSGKTTLAALVAQVLGIPHIEIDALFHGPDWSPRQSFEADVRQFSNSPGWVTEWQYSVVRAVLAERADLLVWLDLSRSTVMYQVIRRTLRRRLHREVLWNGNVEAPLKSIFTDRQHIVRWAWTTHGKTALRVATLREQRPELPIIRLTSRSAARHWLDGPLRQARCSTA